MSHHPDHNIALEIWHKGVAAVGGHASVTSALNRIGPERPDAIIAVGKAAVTMMQAALAHYGHKGPALVVTKYGHTAYLPQNVRLIEAAHPVPDKNSLLAGQALLHAVSDMDPGSHLLVLVSGGASSLAELPVAGLSLADLARKNSRLLASGLDIHAMNTRRREWSRIKGGQLLGAFRGALVTSLAISDVAGDEIPVIGSGIGAAPDDCRFVYAPHIVASNTVARNAAADAATGLGLKVIGNAEILYGDVNELAARVAGKISGASKGVYIFGGEPTVVLPDNPGRGGRNQALALLLAREIRGSDRLHIIVGGTDGNDGPTDAAGALIDGTTWGAGAQQALAAADSGTWLDQRGALLRTGPTGTNVMDLVIVLRS